MISDAFFTTAIIHAVSILSIFSSEQEVRICWIAHQKVVTVCLNEALVRKDMPTLQKTPGGLLEAGDFAKSVSAIHTNYILSPLLR